MIDKLHHCGVWKIEHLDENNAVIKTEIIQNHISDVALNEWANALAGTAADMEIKYLALGTGDSVINSADTQLGAEVFRKPDTSLAKVSVGQTKSEFTIAADEALAAIKEIGVFCGSAATSSANTGLMLSRILWDSDRTSNATAVRFIRIDTFERK